MVQYFENEFQRLIQDETLLKQREEKSECLRKLGMLADEIYTEVLMEHEENHAESSHYYKEDLNDFKKDKNFKKIKTEKLWNAMKSRLTINGRFKNGMRKESNGLKMGQSREL